jgi:putative nucleotidyltransferase with HDIG domain
MSISYAVDFASLLLLGANETMFVAATSAWSQCTFRTQSKSPVYRTLFSMASLVLTVKAAGLVYTWLGGSSPDTPLLLTTLPKPLVGAAGAYFVGNTALVATAIGLSTRQNALRVWNENFLWSAPSYFVGALAAAASSWVVQRGGDWMALLTSMPVYLLYRTYKVYLGRVQDEQRHVREVSDLHLATIEALALAIDAKDHNTHDHLQRVQLYAVEIGKDLGLPDAELDALRAAAVLHDIGKLAVPESIISKPGKLTRAEFDKMKIHPIVGAQILERVDFPYPVVPIVRSHHEKWDGTGYPEGLRGKEIPIGARILAAVDCLDALASDRQYRRALPLDEAMARVAAESGTAFDPAVVSALQVRYQELETRAKAASDQPNLSLATDIKVTRGSAPAAGFEAEAPKRSERIHPVVRARALTTNAQGTRGMLAAGAWLLHGEEALAVNALRIRGLVGYDALAFYGCEDDVVRPKFVTGDHARPLRSLSVPLGEGLIGWVAEVGTPILNGNPTVEPGFVHDCGSAPELGSALALPLMHSGRVAGVLALYRSDNDAFAAAELVSLLELCPQIAAILACMDDEAPRVEEPAVPDKAQEALREAFRETELLLTSQ